jgi:hypothetical protein
MEKELLTLTEHLSSLPVCSGVHVALSLVFCVVFCRLLFVLFLLAIVLSVLLITSLVSSNSSCKFQISQHNDYHSKWLLLIWSPVYHPPSSLCLILTGFIIVLDISIRKDIQKTYQLVNKWDSSLMFRHSTLFTFRVSEWLLFSIKWAILVAIYNGENTLHSGEMIMMSAALY